MGRAKSPRGVRGGVDEPEAGAGKKRRASKATSSARSKPASASLRPRGHRGVEASAIASCLASAIPHPRIELDHESAFELLIATILSAQSTDRNVNKVTPVLFRRWATPAALAAADPEAVEEVVKSTGFFRNKTKAIIGASRVIAERFGGQVPRTMEAMLELPGVARKTANVVLGGAYGIALGVIVDTHVGRVARRLGLTDEEDPEKVERDLMAAFPRDAWIAIGQRLVLHGRYLCTARAPECVQCPLAELCPSREAEPVEPQGARIRSEAALFAQRAVELPDPH